MAERETITTKVIPALVVAAIVGLTGYLVDTRDDVTQLKHELAQARSQLAEIGAEINRLHPRQ